MRDITKYRILILCLFFNTVLFHDQTAQILNSNPGFETGDLTGYRESANNDQNGTITVTNTRVRAGTYSMKVDHTGMRSEVMLLNNIGNFDWYTEYWLGVSIYVETFGTGHAAYNTYVQMHSHPHNDDWTYGSGESGFTIGSKFNYLYPVEPYFHFHSEQLTESEATTFVPSTGAYGNDTQYAVPVSQMVGKWTDFVVHWYWTPYNDGNGFMELWVDGVLQVDYTGPNIYLLDKGGRVREPYCNIQFGSYKSSSSTNNTILYFDELRIGDASASYEDVAPNGSQQSNSPPVLSSIGNQYVTEGETLNFTLTANDPDGDQLVYSIIQGADFVSLNDNQDGTATVTAAPDIGDAGNYELVFRVTDPSGNSDSESATMIVEESSSGNSPPVLSSIGNQYVTEGEILNFTLTASDPDGDQLAYSILQGVDFVSLSDNQDGTATVTAAPESGDIGNYELIFRVADPSGSSDSKSLILIVEETSSGNSNPVLSAIGDISVLEGNTEYISISASDPEGDVMSFSISPILSFIELVDNQDGTGSLSINPLAGDFGIYDIVVTVTDGFDNSDSESFSITVVQQENGNGIPFIENIDDQFINVGEATDVKIIATDVDDDALTFSLDTNLDFLSLINEGNGEARININPQLDDAGVYEVIISVSDPYNGFATESFSLVVNDDININSYVINSGGKSVSSGSILAKEDNYYIGGKAEQRSSNFDITGTNGDEIYQSARVGDFNYEIPVPENGIYIVRLYFAEITFEEGDLGKRIFNVNIENGQQELINFDIIADVGARQALVKSFTGIHINDGKISISVEKVVGNALLSGIELIYESDAVTQISDDEFSANLSVYPNPSEGIFSIELGEGNNISQGLPYIIYDLAGNVVYEAKITGYRELVNLNGIKSGLYLLKIGEYPVEKIIIK